MELTSIQSIGHLISEAEAVTSWAPVPLGSILRTHAYSYRDWGIVITPENVEWLKEQSKLAFACEWAETDASMNSMIGEASGRAGLSDVNAGMNLKIGEYASERVLRLARMGERPYCMQVLDIGAGAGGTSAAFARSLMPMELGWNIGISLTLLEPSILRLDAAIGALRSLTAGKDLGSLLSPVALHGTADLLRGLPNDCFDIVISNAAIHHESFNDHLPQIHRILKPGAQFISGDWHEATYESPAKAYWIYYLLQAPHDDEAARLVMDFALGSIVMGPMPEIRALEDFRKLFGLDKDDVLKAFNGLTRNEREACVGSMKYWLELGRKFSEEGKKCPEMLLQCHERVSKRTEALKNAGFVFDEECRNKYFELLKERGYGELAAVMAPKKAAR